MSGKGSRSRPFSVDQQTFTDNWDRIFGKNKSSKDLPESEWDAYSGLPNPDAYKKEQDADKS